MARSRVRMQWRRGAFADLRTQPDLLDELDGHAERIAAVAGKGYEATPARTTGGRVRGRAVVLTATPRAMVDNAKNHTLMRALGRGNG